MENEKIIPAAQYKKEVLDDYYTALVSRNMSLTGRREVLGGRAKFGIFGDGKELPQIAMAKVFRKAISAQDITATRHSCWPKD